MSRRYQRARSPEQKAQRTSQILEAASAMLTRSFDSAGLSLNELAKRAGMSKSNIYRYFESREAILLAVLAGQNAAWERACVEGLEGIDAEVAVDDRLRDACRVLARETARRPVQCHLTAILASVLERNIGVQTVRDFKLGVVAMAARLSAAMHHVVPELSVEQHGELLMHCLAYMAGAWPLSQPNDTVRQVLEAEGLRGFQHDFERDLGRAAWLMARGLLAESESVGSGEHAMPP